MGQLDDYSEKVGGDRVNLQKLIFFQIMSINENSGLLNVSGTKFRRRGVNRLLSSILTLDSMVMPYWDKDYTKKRIHYIRFFDRRVNDLEVTRDKYLLRDMHRKLLDWYGDLMMLLRYKSLLMKEDETEHFIT